MMVLLFWVSPLPLVVVVVCHRGRARAQVALFVDGEKKYGTLWHPDGALGRTVRVPLQRLLRNGTVRSTHTHTHTYTHTHSAHISR